MCQVKSKLEFNLNSTFTILWAFTSWARSFPWKTKYFLIFCSQFSYTWTSGYQGETPFSGCCLLLWCIFHPKPFNWLHVNEFTIPNSPVPLPRLSCSNLCGSHRGCHIPECLLHISSNTPTEPFPLFLQQRAPTRAFLHCTGLSPWHCQGEMRLSKVSLKFAQWLCRNTSEGNTQCSPHARVFSPL